MIALSSMKKINVEILEEFGNDIDAVCTEIEYLRQENEEQKEKNAELQKEINEHECSV